MFSCNFFLQPHHNLLGFMKSVFEQRAFGATIQISDVTTWEVLLEVFIKSRELCAIASKR